MVKLFSLERKTILITGASSGIGRQCAISASKAGAMVILLGRNTERLKETRLLIEPEKTKIVFSIDLTNEDEIKQFALKIIEENIAIDGIIHAAGISTTLPIRNLTEKKLELFFKTNVAGPISLTRELSKKNGGLRDEGSVIFLASVMASVGEVGKTLYGMSKGAILAGSKSMAIELARRKIRVNTVSPGVVISPMSESSTYAKDTDSLKKIEDLHPLGLGSVHDVANACLYLLSDASKWVTGSNLTIDGGYTAR